MPSPFKGILSPTALGILCQQIPLFPAPAVSPPPHPPPHCAHLLQSELSDVRSVEVPALEARHRDVLSKASSEVARLKHAVKEAEAVAAAAQAQLLEASSQPTLQAQLHDAVRERERCELQRGAALSCDVGVGVGGGERLLE